MEIEYQLTADDLYAFQWRAAYESATARRARRQVIGGLFLVFLLTAVMPAVGSAGFRIGLVNVLIITVVLPMAAAIYWLLERRMMRRAILTLVQREKPGKGQLGTHRIVLSDAGIVETTEVGESLTAWEGIDRVEQNSGYIFIYTTPAAAHIIPKRAFTGTRAIDFFEEARRRLERS